MDICPLLCSQRPFNSEQASKVTRLPSVALTSGGFALQSITQNILGHPGDLLIQVLLNVGSRIFLVTGAVKT